MAKKYIEQEKLLNLIYKCNGRVPEWIKDCVSECPSEDVRPEKHGKWSDTMIGVEDEISRFGDHSFKDFHFGFKCSVCGAVLNKTKYCGNCGAKMDGKDGENNENHTDNP
ncbi:MAG: hypothetical protein NC394_08880 [Bacteroides sp.]|nr:hypothetical protein [Bacteroides sp.]